MLSKLILSLKVVSKGRSLPIYLSKVTLAKSTLAKVNFTKVSSTNSTLPKSVLKSTLSHSRLCMFLWNSLCSKLTLPKSNLAPKPTLDFCGTGPRYKIDPVIFLLSPENPVTKNWIPVTLATHTGPCILQYLCMY